MLQVWRATVLLFLIAAADPAGGARAQDRAPVGEVVALQGDATVSRPSGVTVLTRGAAILRSDRIVTGAGSRIRIRFLDGTVVAIGAGTDLVVADYAVEAGQRRSGLLAIIRGLFRATVAPGLPGARFDVETATAIASVRSTDWMAETSVENTSVFVIDGAVAVSSKAPAPIETVLLQPGEGTDVPAAAVPTAPVRWGQARIDALLARTAVP